MRVFATANIRETLCGGTGWSWGWRRVGQTAIGSGRNKRVGERRFLTRSFVEGPTSPPLLTQTIPAHFAEIVRAYGDRTAIISRHQKTRLSYRELDDESESLARGLLKKGVKKGMRVGVLLGNGREFGVITYALFKIGAILVPLNPAFNANQVVSALTHLDASHLIVSAETNLPFKPPRSNVPLLSHIVPSLQSQSNPTIESQLIPSLKNIILVDNSSGRINTTELKATSPYAQVLEDGSGAGRLGEKEVGVLDANDVVNIQFTSGTTSMPKAACLSHRSILNNGNSIGDRMMLTEKDIVCCPPPLFHCFGCILGYMATATHGSAIVFPAESFDPMATLHSVRDYACTALFGVPTMFIAELDLLASGAFPWDPENTTSNAIPSADNQKSDIDSNLSSPSASTLHTPSQEPASISVPKGFEQVRTGIAAGSSIPANLMRKLHRTLNLTELTICYGMTETSPVSFMTTVDDPLEKRISTVGRLLPHVDAKIVDPTDWSRVLPVGERGELAVSGYLLMKGYWGNEAKTSEVLQPDLDGKMWMHTGDEAAMDEEGYVTITGRIKDLIIRGGENIHPLEIENCLFAHPGVGEVSVCGVPDEKYGEVVAAFVVKKSGWKNEDGEELTAEAIREWVKEKLSGYLAPKYVFWVDTYPKTASGKIQKFKIREMAVEWIRDGKGLG
ncbi:acyl-CoA synthetase/AMP-acid ligase-like protein II [Aulographum hederae CBS 113979]|uniref:Acyl-CoA synthetase/AMP-acid ligase-like protein II n=1 Tax=Aulographum hederae CBS 113979 TaxID=1176131 RepID=A0A6G1GX89_9PEZI|nr:acyl-CoA synthetase/AMP-acid ligase-like protein II [Aulographum hederae CBS 113979]